MIGKKKTKKKTNWQKFDYNKEEDIDTNKWVMRRQSCEHRDSYGISTLELRDIWSIRRQSWKLFTGLC